MACSAIPKQDKKKPKAKLKKSKMVNNFDESVRGQLQPIAASMLMRLLYRARHARFDLLKSISRLASSVQYWDKDCDKRLMRLMAYVKGSLKKRLVGWVGDQLHEVQPHAYADADFAGCPRTLRSTSGAQIQIEGPNTRFPLFARSIRQQAAANSTPDAELAAINMAFRVMIVPALDLWEVLLPCSVICFAHEENSACISVICSGKNPTMRYIGRSQGINIQILHEYLGIDNPDCPCYLIKTDSKDMVADIHTKGFIDPADWIHVCQNANMFYGVDLDDVVKPHVEYFLRQKEVEKSNKLPRPPHVHDLRDYLLGSSSQVSSNLPVPDAVACAAIATCCKADGDMSPRCGEIGFEPVEQCKHKGYKWFEDRWCRV